ncbi:hypothetical protein TPHA_0A04440 [Tetrapisispora phaffii CBS 4417]|uniref:Protein DSF2 n=1 Tax=Tetrapisispora phaffii (strain ATCC 24235 / CBS 4417 / NBRC 1672 / NRRL Y-8282 / UCD 70-5) TaxID=1071381 RepID=G8BNN9_TETPH|nr:hypothetical protein TPHA_0A04440 [Tetrapisispora phaffii CBS 4417]CCE61517.1 hypothetical protein TPHA_0A04440 [Tetrapisispora phaffii CBS 4417]
MPVITNDRSPLDDLGNGHFNKNDLIKDKSFKNNNMIAAQSLYSNANVSLMSFDTIATTERLLDKLDLSVDDEEILQQALIEEETKRNQSFKEFNAKGSVPASKFQSLRDVKKIPDQTVKPIENNNLEELSNIKLKNNGTVTSIQQHSISNNRYSYFVEEESDSEDTELNDYNLLQTIHINKNNDTNITNTTNNNKLLHNNNHFQNNIRNNYNRSDFNTNFNANNNNNNFNNHSFQIQDKKFSQNKRQPFQDSHNFPRNPSPGLYLPNHSMSAMTNNRNHYQQFNNAQNIPGQREKVRNVINFEKYRVQNNIQSHQGHNLPKSRSVHNQSTNNNFPSTQALHNLQQNTKPFHIFNKNTDPVIRPNKISNTSSQKTQRSQSFELNTSEALTKPISHSSADTIPTTPSKNQTNNNSILFSTETSASVNKSSPAATSLKLSSHSTYSDTEPDFKTHKKKSSFSLKNIFRSPKANKDKRASSELSEENTVLPLNREFLIDQGDTSISSPDKKNKFQFGGPLHMPKNLRLNKGNHKNKEGYSQHARSFSDYADTNLGRKHFENSVSKVQSNSDVYNKNGNDIRYFANPERKMSMEEQHLIVDLSTTNNKQSQSLKVNNNVTSNSETQSNVIDNALKLRNEGKVEESTEVLRLACFESNLTAFLLYGLALRNGYGVTVNYKQSLHYIKEATGILSFEEQVFEVDIDPIKLERESSVPDKIQEPQVPALYEYGIAYLKGYGFDEPNEQLGLKCLGKAASLGHVDSMCICGTIWSRSSYTRKRDLVKAAAWFRIAKSKGVDLVGSDWIYKDKYKEPSSI